MLVSNFYKYLMRKTYANDNVTKIRRSDVDNDIVWTEVDSMSSLFANIDIHLGTSPTSSFEPSYNDFLTTSYSDYSSRFSITKQLSFQEVSGSIYAVIDISAVCNQYVILNMLWITAKTGTNQRPFMFYEEKFADTEYNANDTFNKQIMIKLN